MAVKPKNVLTLYPNTDALEEGQKSLLTKDRSIIFGRKSLTLSKFIQDIASPAEAHIPVTTERALIHNILGNHRLKYFEAIKGSPGTTGLFSETINKLKRNNISPEILRDILERRGGPKENDLLTIYERYEARLRDLGVTDESDVTSMAIERIKKGGSNLLDDITEIALAQFHKLSVGEIAVIKLISQTLPKIKISLELFKVDNKCLYNSEIDAISKEFVNTSVGVRLREIKPFSVYDLGKINPYTTASPKSGARFLALRILELKGEGIPLEKIGLLLKGGMPYTEDLIREISKALTGNEIPLQIPFAKGRLIQMILGSDTVNKLPERGAVGSFIEVLNQRLEDIKNWADRFRSTKYKVEIAPSLGWLEVYNDIIKELEFNSNLLKLNELTRREFLDLLNIFLSASPQHMNPPPEIPISFLEFSKPVTKEMEYLFVPNLNEGNIPAGFSPCEFFATPEFADGADALPLLSIFPPPQGQLAEEEFLWNLWTSTPKRIGLIFSLFDHLGRELSPSSFARHIIKEDSPPLFVSPPPILKGDHEIKEIKQRIKSELEHTLDPEIIKERSIKDDIKRRFSDHLFSVSQLEDYAECPFIYFCKTVMGFEPEEEETPEVRPTDRGNVMHKILENFFSQNIKLFTDAIEDPSKESVIKVKIQEITESVFQESDETLRKSNPQMNPRLLEDLKQRAAALCHRTITLELKNIREVKSPLRPLKTEWEFGFSSPFTLKGLNGGEIKIRGRIDRIDTDEKNKRYLIIDYKTGDVDSIRNNVIKKKHLQIPVYIEAAAKTCMEGLEPLGGLLLAVQSGEKKQGLVRGKFNKQYFNINTRTRSLCTDEDFELLKKEALDGVREYVEAIKLAKFFYTHGDCPGYCKYADICRTRQESPD